jgi:hypothetical protein
MVWKRRRSLTLIPYGGLGNRLRVLNSAFLMARKLDAELELIWFKKRELNSDLEALFSSTGYDYMPASPMQVALLQPFLKHIWIQKYENLYRKILGLFYDKVYFDSDILALTPLQLRADVRKYQRVLIATCQQFYNFSNFDNFEVTPDIRKRINVLAANFDHHTVGVHIRRTDHTALIEASPLELFVSHMTRLVEENPAVRFFLATDDEAVKQSLQQQFGERLMTQHVPLTRDSHEGMAGAVVDIYALSRTQKIICTTKSSFAKMAAMIGLEKEIIEVA